MASQYTPPHSHEPEAAHSPSPGRSHWPTLITLAERSAAHTATIPDAPTLSLRMAVALS